MAAGGHVALIRGINVGKAKRVAMADLRSLIEDLGYRGVRTLLNSGNVVFTAPAATALEAAARIEQALAQRTGVSARVTVLTADEIATAVSENPLVDVATDATRLLVAVLFRPSDRSLLTPLAERDWAPERIAVGARVAYLWCPDGMLASRLPEAVGRLLGDSVTTRNWATFLKIRALLVDGS